MDKNDRIVERVQFPNASKIKLLRTAAYARVSSGKDAMLHSLSAAYSMSMLFIRLLLAGSRPSKLSSSSSISGSVDIPSIIAAWRCIPFENELIEDGEILCGVLPQIQL